MKNGQLLRVKILEILEAYIDEVDGIDFKHIPDYKLNSIANDILAIEENESEKKQCMYCEKIVDYSSGIFTCGECSGIKEVEKEFAKWIGFNCVGYEDTNEWLYSISPMEDKWFHSFKEIYQYWLDNIKDK